MNVLGWESFGTLVSCYWKHVTDLASSPDFAPSIEALAFVVLVFLVFRVALFLAVQLFRLFRRPTPAKLWTGTLVAGDDRFIRITRDAAKSQRLKFDQRYVIASDDPDVRTKAIARLLPRRPCSMICRL